MTGRIFIQVILPLRLEWEPFYYQEIELSESAGDASGLFPVTSTGSVTERDKEQVRVGDRVRVNFAGKEYVGVVSMADAGKQAEEMGIVDKVKPILGMAEGLEPVTKEEIELWRQIAEYYLCTVGEVYKAAYPAQKVEKEVVQARQEALKVEREEKNRTKIADKIKRLEERAEKKAELAAKARKSESRERYLAEKEMLEGEIGLLVRELTSMVGELCRTTGSVTGYGDSVTYHQDEEPIGGSIIETSEGTEKEISLSAAQEEAYSKIKEIFAKGKPALLHGVTGSGKTEIYLKLAQETLAMGKNVLYLVPEIALSRQLEDRISETFPELLVFHSGETMSRKREVATVLRHAGEPAEGKGYVVLGTRSAIFLPHKNLGLVIVDEEHDTSYKQDSPAPRYNGRETAIMMAKIFGANVILGSATPSLESLYNCSVGRYGLVTLNKRFYDAADSDIEIIDTIAERRKNGMIGNFSRKLIEHIGKCLGEHRQVLILRERRAYSPIVQCQECGEIPKCRCCNVSLSLHRRADGSERLVCHYCGRVYEYTGKCHKCGGELKPLGSGTQKIEEEASKLFPNARIARLDSDTAQSRKYETDTIRKFSNGEIDILIGTRMVAKGFDFSGLSLVAVLQADSILGQEDYRADERGLQLLEQFRGRCGRRGEKGLFVIQTSQPEHPVYQSIDGKLDENGTMARFLGERKLFGYPPYSRVIGVVIKDYNQARVDLLSRDLGEYLRGALAVKVSFAPGVQNGPNVIGPYSPAIDKISNQNIRQIRVLLPKDRSLARNKETLAAAVERFEKEKKYSGHIALDVDPA
jgi:primosomal protein N' (replication factor Y)|uniref:replication restart helicase PriA n=1 Tax=Candidatus Cryptobacteroides bacterium TaxID=3085639 RepID=UPI0040261F09